MPVSHHWRRGLAGLAVLLGCVLIWLMLRPAAERPVAHAVDPLREPLVIPALPPEPLPGERILAALGQGTPQEDLTWMHRLIDNYRLVVKGAFPLGSNAEISAALRGEGRVAVPYLPGTHKVFDSAGRMIDRWGVPFFFHAEAEKKLSIRSAGPDREMWTADDEHRLPHGEFLRGEKLNPASLYQAE